MEKAPGFAMAHILQGYILLCSRDPGRVRAAQSVLQRAAGLQVDEREAMHLRAIAGVLADDYDLAREHLSALLQRHPRDVLALHAAHAFDYLVGDTDRLSSRVEAVLPAWSAELPGYHAVLSMQAFGLGECGDCDAAEGLARAALTANPRDARAHHVMAHVFEMSDRAEAGLLWLQAHQPCWAEDSMVATHCWWHLALFLIESGQLAAAMEIYDQRMQVGRKSAVSDLIDASALLWRLQLSGQLTGDRWAELAAAWSKHADDAFCSFTDLHAMLAFVGAQDWARAQRLERLLAARESTPTRHGRTTQMLGLPACRALIAFGRGDCPTAIRLLAGLPALAHRLGGSHAQRDVMHLTLLHAIEQVRRPARQQAARGRASELIGHGMARGAARPFASRGWNRGDHAADAARGD
jgi:hypothetical protein